jgi:DNA repair exonuclease SbcCD ATPase subunit
MRARPTSATGPRAAAPRSELEAKAAERDEFEARLAIRDAAFVAVDAVSKRLRGDLMAQTTRAGRLETELAASAADSAALKAELALLADEGAKLGRQLAEANTAARQTAALHTETQARLKAVIATERDRAAQLEDYIKALRTEHADARMEADRRFAAIEAAFAAAKDQSVREKDELTKALALAERDRLDLSASLERVGRDRDDLAKKLEDTVREGRDLESKLALAERGRADLSGSLEQAGRGRDDLAKKLELAVRAAQDIESKLGLAGRERTELSSSLEQAGRVRDDLAKNLQLVTIEKDSLAAKLQQREAYCRELQLACDGYLERIEALKRRKWHRGDKRSRATRPFIGHRAPAMHQLASALALLFRPRPQARSTVTLIPFDTASGVEGFLDRFGPTSIAGWLYDRDRPAEPLSIAIYDGERFLCSAGANRNRPDVARAGKAGSRCGFDFSVPAALFDGKPHEIDIRIAGTARSLLADRIVIQLASMPPTAPAE